MAPQVYLITGANKGLGYEAVRILAERFRDDAIVLLGTRSHERGKAALAKIRQSNPSFDYANVHLVKIDVSKLEWIQAAADFVKAKYGNVHVLINNAALTTHAEGPKMCFQVNVFGVYDTLNVFYPLLVPHESSNIVVASAAGAWTLAAMSPDLQSIFEDFTALDDATVRDLLDDWLAAYEGKPSKYTWPSPEESTRAYGISKTVVMALTRKWAVEHPEIKTTIVCPGYSATNMTAHSGHLTAAEGAENLLYPIFHADKTESGGFYREGERELFNTSRPAGFGAK
ncbi:hypothetical protein AC1031_010204 [Aphanomyces cochlioides]|nr:hypothetical protein AC1031_010204 [Aphanomyces cochlioides]